MQKAAELKLHWLQQLPFAREERGRERETVDQRAQSSADGLVGLCLAAKSKHCRTKAPLLLHHCGTVPAEGMTPSEVSCVCHARDGSGCRKATRSRERGGWRENVCVRERMGERVESLAIDGRASRAVIHCREHMKKWSEAKNGPLAGSVCRCGGLANGLADGTSDGGKEKGHCSLAARASPANGNPGQNFRPLAATCHDLSIGWHV